MAHPGGRPTDYRDDLPQKLIEKMAEGKSVTQFCSEIDISRDTFYNWVDKHEEFSYAFKKAKEKCESKWETWLQDNIANKEVNSGLVKLYFTNRFNWRTEKSEQKTESKVEVVAELSDVSDARKVYQKDF